MAALGKNPGNRSLNNQGCPGCPHTFEVNSDPEYSERVPDSSLKRGKKKSCYKSSCSAARCGALWLWLTIEPFRWPATPHVFVITACFEKIQTRALASSHAFQVIVAFWKIDPAHIFNVSLFAIRHLEKPGRHILKSLIVLSRLQIDSIVDIASDHVANPLIFL